MLFDVFGGAEFENHVSFFVSSTVFNVLTIFVHPTEIVLLVLCTFSYFSYNRFQLVAIFCNVYSNTRITIKTAFC